MGPPRRIDPTTQSTLSERCYHGATSREVTKLWKQGCRYFVPVFIPATTQIDTLLVDIIRRYLSLLHLFFPVTNESVKGFLHSSKGVF